MSGIYEINIPEIGSSRVFCDMQIDGGGWIMIQRRFGLDTSFSRTWDEYKHGFNYFNYGDFWLGLEKLHRLASPDKNAVLRIDITSLDHAMLWAVYKTFQVAGESEGYRLYIDNFDAEKSNMANSFLSPDVGVFVTYDRDNGAGLSTVAQKQQGGWWANGLGVNNLNAAGPANDSKSDWIWSGVHGVPIYWAMKLRY